MSPAELSDAVNWFSEHAEAFHGLYTDQPQFVERLQVWHDVLDRYARPGALALDMGCGSGIFSFYLAEKGCRVVGIDGAADMVALCERQRADRGLEHVTFQ